MPRVSFKEFCNRHEKLQKAWEDSNSPFLALEPNEQWNLHDYYCPGMTLTTEELKVRWRSLHSASTSLHQQAGRAYAKLKPYLDGRPYYLVLPERRATSAKNCRVVVRGVVNPQLDAEVIALAVALLARQMQQGCTSKSDTDIL